MQLVRNGPDVPERLLQAHEDGRVVFFCGAGISCPAGLPGFADLVNRLFSEVGETPSTVEAAAIKNAQHDIAIGLLEGRVVGGRETVRRELAEILTPACLPSPKTTATHEALLTLSRGRDGRHRLVTTNCDRIFEEVISRRGLQLPTFEAPLLPVPKRRWSGGLVYLHGLIPEAPAPGQLDQLVISSGDFGLAYLAERWAARFVSELFRNFTVCFVGYSIDDPVLRYMTDALAADRLLGESPPEMFAFGNHSRRKERETADQWTAKNVTPILYRNHSRHAYLHRTLAEWPALYRDGVSGKEYIVAQYATSKPLASTRQDDFVGRMIWALSEKSALPAKRFAELEPVPPIDWLEPLTERRFGRADLSRFGVQPDADEERDLTFSLVARPAPYRRSPLMTLVQSPRSSTEWDDVMEHLAKWLVRHLQSPKLVLWVANHGGVLHPRFAGLIARELVGNPPEKPILSLWLLVLSGQLKGQSPNPDLFEWGECFRKWGLTPSLRISLRALLSPRVRLSDPARWSDGEEGGKTVRRARARDALDSEVVLVSNHAHSELRSIAAEAKWADALPELLADATTLLYDCLDLMQVLRAEDDRYDPSHYHRPSIEDHPQNCHYHDWTALIELARDAWLATAKKDPERAKLAAEHWMRLPYPVFRRLAFYAASRPAVVSPGQSLKWLLTEDHRWLWSVETHREAIRLIVALVPELAPGDRALLEDAILEGPPRMMFPDTIEEQELQRIVDRETWLRLAKSQAAGAGLGPAAANKLERLSRQCRAWHLAEDQRDEFPVWIGEGDWGRNLRRAPEGYRELLDWLRRYPQSGAWDEDDWRALCKRRPRRTAAALIRLTRQGQWLAGRWSQALYAWSDEALAVRSWRCVGSVLAAAPDGMIGELAYPLGAWLQAVAKQLTGNVDAFFALIQRALGLCRGEEAETDQDAVLCAVNHPIGQITWAALHCWQQQELRDGQGLPTMLKRILSEVCDVGVERYRHGRVLLAAHVVVLYRVDREWSTEYLLPLFDWERFPAEACAAWQGFSSSPRLYRPLMEAVGAQFLATARHYSALGKWGDQYASTLTFAALEPGHAFSRQDLATATRAMPREGLEAAAEALVRALQGAGEQRAEYWRNRVLPYYRHVWPKSSEVKTPRVSSSFAGLCIAAHEAFPKALRVLKHWLMPIEHYGYIGSQLKNSGLAERFPAEVLTLLDSTIGEEVVRFTRDVHDCLEAISSAEPALESDLRFVRLSQRVRLQGKA